MQDGTRNGVIEQRGYAAPIEREPPPSSLDPHVSLALVEALHVINAHVATTPDPAQQRITLSRNAASGAPVGNPAEWAGFPAKSICVLNPNAFEIGVGAGGSGAGDPTRPGAIVIAPSRLVVLPLADEVYSFGTAAVNIATADATVWAWRYATVLAPAIYAL